MFNFFFISVGKRDEKRHIYKHRVEPRGHRFNFEYVEAFGTECMEGKSRIIEAVHTKIRRSLSLKLLLSCSKKTVVRIVMYV